MNDTQIILGLRKLIGFTQNASDTILKIYQDDATQDFYVSTKAWSITGDDFKETLIKAITEHGEDYIK